MTYDYFGHRVRILGLLGQGIGDLDLGLTIFPMSDNFY